MIKIVDNTVKEHKLSINTFAASIPTTLSILSIINCTNLGLLSKEVGYL